jgi:hypothetical protein
MLALSMAGVRVTRAESVAEGRTKVFAGEDESHDIEEPGLDNEPPTAMYFSSKVGLNLSLSPVGMKAQSFCTSPAVKLRSFFLIARH